MNIFTG